MHTTSYILQHGLESLKKDLNITIKERDNLILLDYDQILSPKLHPVVLECRGLILEKDTYNIVFRCMERFFNYTEANTDKLDYSNAQYFDKLDGSLIKIYNYLNKWYVATRGTIVADNMTPFDISFQDLVFKALNIESDTDFQSRANSTLNPNISYNFEVTSIENRIVTKYDGYTLTYLNARDTQSGSYLDEATAILAFGAKLNTPLLSSLPIETVLEYVDNIPDLREGLVAYINNVPVCKFKNRLYVDIHHSTFSLVNEHGLSTKRVVKIVIKNEQDEYLSYFPEKLFLFQPYIDAKLKLIKEIEDTWDIYKDTDSIKEFAKHIKNLPYTSILFTKYREPTRTVEDIFTNSLLDTTQIKLLETYKDS